MSHLVGGAGLDMQYLEFGNETPTWAGRSN